eukprot:TRINITY_DN3467_c0_g2_i3.p4 TRINITY_DN3467_c0_g2~~TRINITY_DN3467_c0_g2_i3.p4  ORF type:complete len:116 (-),score=3.47 TRINITY_DN3467_c0_g2_i3:590-937(-)
MQIKQLNAFLASKDVLHPSLVNKLQERPACISWRFAVQPRGRGQQLCGEAPPLHVCHRQCGWQTWPLSSLVWQLHNVVSPRHRQRCAQNRAVQFLVQPKCSTCSLFCVALQSQCP